MLDNASEDGSADAAVRERFPGVRLIGAGASGRLRREPQHRDPRDERPLRLRPQRGHDERGLGPRAHGRPPRREPARRRARAAARLPRRAPAGLGLALPEPGGRGARAAHARPRRRRRSRAGARPATSTGRWARRCSLRREALDEVGLFDEGFFIYSEETDLCRRLREAGWRTQYFPQVTVVHHESQFSAGIPERRVNEMWRSRHRYWRKHHSAPGGPARRALHRGAVRDPRPAPPRRPRLRRPDAAARPRLAGASPARASASSPRTGTARGRSGPADGARSGRRREAGRREARARRRGSSSPGSRCRRAVQCSARSAPIAKAAVAYASAVASSGPVTVTERIPSGALRVCGSNTWCPRAYSPEVATASSPVSITAATAVALPRMLDADAPRPGGGGAAAQPHVAARAERVVARRRPARGSRPRGRPTSP